MWRHSSILRPEHALLPSWHSKDETWPRSVGPWPWSTWVEVWRAAAYLQWRSSCSLCSHRWPLTVSLPPGFAWKASLRDCSPRTGFCLRKQFAEEINRTSQSVTWLSMEVPWPNPLLPKSALRLTQPIGRHGSTLRTFLVPRLLQHLMKSHVFLLL